MTQSKHTPTTCTLTYSKATDGSCIVHDAPLGNSYKVRILTDTEDRAAFIVKAVNNHEMLIEALQEISDLYIKKGDAGLRLAAAADIADDALADAKEEVAS